MRNIAILIATAGLIAGLYLGLVRHPGARRTSSPPAVGESAPALTLVDLGGNRIDTAALRGKVVLINFWAAWCTPCREEIPQFVTLQDKYGPQGFQAIGISMDDKEDALRDFCSKYKVNYPVVIGNQKIAQEYGGILGLPTSLLVGRDGRIHEKLAGSTDFARLERDVGMLLQARQ